MWLCQLRLLKNCLSGHSVCLVYTQDSYSQWKWQQNIRIWEMRPISLPSIRNKIQLPSIRNKILHNWDSPSPYFSHIMWSRHNTSSYIHLNQLSTCNPLFLYSYPLLRNPFTSFSVFLNFIVPQHTYLHSTFLVTYMISSPHITWPYHAKLLLLIFFR